jgi:hypothetical protein
MQDVRQTDREAGFEAKRKVHAEWLRGRKQEGRPTGRPDGPQSDKKAKRRPEGPQTDRKAYRETERWTDRKAGSQATERKARWGGKKRLTRN